LAQDSELSDLWIELDAKINFDIKFLEEGLKANHKVAGVKDILKELEKQTKLIFDKFIERG
jgi:hypothetical protein